MHERNRVGEGIVNMQYYMGTAYQAAGDKNQAKKMFQAALKFFKDHNDNDMIAQAETAIDGLKRRSK